MTRSETNAMGPTSAAPVEVVRQFVRLINAHDVDGIVAMLSDDHVFTDSLGDTLSGHDDLRRGWEGYFVLFPDYTVEPRHEIPHGSGVALFGTARGTYAVNGELHARNRWEIPLAAYAVVDDGLLRSWQVYADNEPVRRVLGA